MRLEQISSDRESELGDLIHFEDGVEWLLRSPSNEYGAVSCRKTNAKLLESEAVTLKYIRTHSSIPVPEVFDYR